MIWFSVEELLARLICTASFFGATYGGGCISSLRISTNWLRTTCSCCCCCCSSSRVVPSFSSTSGSWLRRGGFHHRRPAKAKAMMTNALPTGPQIVYHLIWRCQQSSRHFTSWRTRYRWELIALPPNSVWFCCDVLICCSISLCKIFEAIYEMIVNAISHDPQTLFLRSNRDNK